MNCQNVSGQIVGWMRDYAANARVDCFVVGVSGGVDSALVSTLAAMSGLRTICVSLPIHQPQTHLSRADKHIEWLKSKYANVESVVVDLSSTFDTMIASLPQSTDTARQQLTEANTRSRLRMTALYYVAGLNGALVAGTGNKVEDYGVGFFTKYGDGGVDISPIGDLTKSDVWELSAWAGVSSDIVQAKPTDGLFGDDRSDEDQIGASYKELEWAMEQSERGAVAADFEGRQREVFEIFVSRNRANCHKVSPIPVCTVKR